MRTTIYYEATILRTHTKPRRRRVTADTGLHLAGRDRGFTIIELLIVMAIIGLLAAIAIPIYSKIRSNAYDAALQSDLRQSAIQTEASVSGLGFYPSDQTSYNNSVAPYVKLSDNGNEYVVYTKGTGAGLNGYTIWIADSHTPSVFCYQSSLGGSQKNADGYNGEVACVKAAANN